MLARVISLVNNRFQNISICWPNSGLRCGSFLGSKSGKTFLTLCNTRSGDSTTFEILRQASLNGKIAFNMIDDKPLGGVIEISLSSPDLVEWLEAATWHKGRDIIPRNVNDEKMMNSDGDSAPCSFVETSVVIPSSIPLRRVLPPLMNWRYQFSSSNCPIVIKIGQE